MDLAGLQAAAEAVLDPAAAEYVARGSAAGDTRAANIAAWRRLRLRPHVLHDTGDVAVSTTVLGVPVAFPVLVAPTARHDLAHDGAERATARATAAAHSLMVVSMASSTALDDVAAAAPDAPRFAQMYVLRDRGATRAYAERIAATGCRALIASVDGAAVPYGAAFRDRGLPAEIGRLVDDFDPSVTIDDLVRLREWSGLPLVVKGVLRGDDARRCVDAGASAVYVSNHVGRIVDGCVDTATALDDVVAAVGTDAEVYVDGGIRSGVDVLRALALGARAVLIGRPVLWGLAVDGERGVRAVLETFATELRRALAFCGAIGLEAITHDLVLPSPA